MSKNIDEALLNKIEHHVIGILEDLEYKYNLAQGLDKRTRFLVSHSLRVANIAKYIAEREDLDPTLVYIAALLHDLGKFVWKKNREYEGAREEEISARYAENILVGLNLLDNEIVKNIKEIIQKLYGEKELSDKRVAILHDADALDRVGYHGVYTFLSKWTIRGEDLETIILKRLPGELTYIQNIEKVMVTKTGKKLARLFKEKAIKFYEGLLRELNQLGFNYALKIEEYKNMKIVCVIKNKEIISSDKNIEKKLKCMWYSMRIKYIDNEIQEFGFCLPETK